MSNMSMEECMQSSSSQIDPSIITQSTLYKAGAGAGKTTNLIQQIYNYAIAFYQENQKWPRIVVTTFTRKATQELKERLTLHALKNINEKTDTKSQSFLEDFLFSNQIHISTIDGLLSHFLKQCAFDAGHDPNFQMIDETTNEQYASIVIRKLLKETPEFQKLFEHNTFESLRKLCFEYRSSFYTIKKLKPASFKDLIDTSINKIKSHWNILNQLEDDIIKKESTHIENCFQSLSKQNNIFDLYKELLDAFEKINISKIKVKKELKEQFNEDVKECKKFFKNKHFYHIDYLREFADYFSLFDEFAIKFIQDFEEIKNDEGLMSIRDLEFKTIKILRDKPQIIKSFSDEWDYWLVDEYQDTTPLQAEVLNKFRGSSKEFIVGDPQQSIYFFRGARPEVFKSKQAAIKNIRLLNTNYRASSSLVHFFNDFFKNMDQEFLEMTPKDSNTISDPVATFICYQESQKDGISNDKLFDKDENHDNAVIAEVISLLNKGASYSDICIIGRTNDDLSRIAYKLGQRDMPYQLFTAKKAPVQQIRQLNALLKFLLNPYDNINFIELIGSSWLGFSKSNLYQLVRQSQNNQTSSLWQELLSSQEDSFDEVKTKLEGLFLNVHQIGVTETLKKTCIEMGMIDFCKVYDPSGNLEAYIWKYFAKLQNEEQKPDFNYLKFASDIIDPTDLEPDSLPSLEVNQLQLMTVHKSKGLEFQHVLIPHLNNNFKPQPKSFYILEKENHHLWETSLKFEEGSKKHCLIGDLASHKIKQREEEELDRLLYVAMTRAKKSVHLFCCDDDGKKGTNWQSRSACHLWIKEKGKQNKTNYSYEAKDFDRNIPKLKTHQEVLPPQIKGRLQLYQKPHIKRVSVSDLLERTLIENQQDIKSQQQYNLLQSVIKTDLGTSYHKVLQAICANPYLIKKPAEDIINEYFSYVFREDKKEQIIQSLDFLLSLKEPPMKEVLMKGHAEWPFLHQKGEEVIEGKIDLWAKVDDIIWVIDYKTGRKSNDKRVIKQLQLYSQALAEKYKQKMKLVAIYLLEKDIMIYDKV